MVSVEDTNAYAEEMDCFNKPLVIQLDGKQCEDHGNSLFLEYEDT
jgi:hypothetical protein